MPDSTLPELEAAIGRRYLERVIRGMQRGGYTIGEDDGRLLLVAEPKTAQSVPHSTEQVGSLPVQANRQAPDSESAAAQLFDLPPISHHRQDVEGHDLARRPRRAA